MRKNVSLIRFEQFILWSYLAEVDLPLAALDRHDRRSVIAQVLVFLPMSIFEFFLKTLGYFFLNRFF